MAEVSERARAWLTGAALPYWSAHGQQADGLFYEQVGYDGAPDAGGFRRMRVQARQLWCLAHARRRGWHAAPGLERGWERFVATCWSPDGRPGWVHRLDPEGGVIDARRDAYDHAFALFALAGVHEALGDPRARELADATLAFMDAEMAHPAGGYVEALPPEPPRRSNPHMHLLEALLAWRAATGDADYLRRADEMVSLFAERFLDPETGTLGEYLDEALSPAPGPPGEVREPGHHFEWTWLLHQAAAAGGRDERAAAGRLYAWAQAHGLDAEGFAVDECDAAGAQIRTRRRAWPQTERLKAQVAVGDGDGARRTARGLLDGYLATDVPGLWIDQFDGEGRPIAPVVPASTFYHLMLGFDQLLSHEEPAEVAVGRGRQ